MAVKTLVGKVSHYFNHVGVAIVEVSKPIKIGETISIEGSITNFKQNVTSMQIDKKPIQSAKSGQSIGLKVDNLVKKGDSVYKV